MLTIRFDVKRTGEDEWGVSDQEVLTVLDGLYRLSLHAPPNSSPQRICPCSLKTFSS